MIGARLVSAIHPETGEEIKRWSKPKHKSVALHFVNEAAKRKFRAGEISEKDAFTKVPIYEGQDNRTYKKRYNDVKYDAKVMSKDWQKEAANIRAVVR
jgi:hypothetical protein